MSETPKKTAMTAKERAKKFRENNREKTRENANAWYNRNKERIAKTKLEEKKRKEEMELKLQQYESELETLKKIIVSHGIQVQDNKYFL